MIEIGLSSKEVLEPFAETMVKDLNKIKFLKQESRYRKVQMVKAREFARVFLTWLDFLEAHNTTGMPPVKITPVEGKGTAFMPTLWEATLDLSQFHKQEELRVAECEDLASSIYHELRHAEQYFLMAYYLAAENPKMIPGDLSRKLGNMHLDTVRKVQTLAKMPRPDLVNAGKALFRGEFHGWTAKVEQDFRSHKGNFQKWLDSRDRVLFTTQVESASEYVTEVSEEIRQHNKARPVSMPDPDDVWRYQAWTLKSGKFNPEVLLKELEAAFKTRQSDPNKFYRAYHMYLAAKKLLALDRWKKTYEAYMLTAAEDDAHTTETLLRVQCAKRGLTVDMGSCRGIPDPVLWTAPKPAPPPPVDRSKKPVGGVRVFPV